MLYLLSELSGTLTPLNVFRYITFRTGGALFTAGFFVFWFGRGSSRSCACARARASRSARTARNRTC